MVENFLELIEIDYIEHTEEYVNMVDISVEVDQSFLLSNGVISHNSAANSFRKYRDATTMGAFCLRGKFINVSEITNQKLIQNTEALNLMASIGLKIGKPINLRELRYGRILIYSDADCLEENTLILTRNGSKKICEINYNDEVLTHTGKYKKVKNIISKDISSFISIKVNGNNIICSENHKLIVMRNGGVIEIEAKDLKYSDFLLLKDKK